MTEKEYNDYFDACTDTAWEEFAHIVFKHMENDPDFPDEITLDTRLKPNSRMVREIESHFQYYYSDSSHAKTVGQLFMPVYEQLEKRIPWWIFIADFANEAGHMDEPYSNYLPWKLPFDELDLVMILTDFEAEYDLDIEMPDVDDEEDYFRHHGEWLDLLGRYIETLGEDD